MKVRIFIGPNGSGKTSMMYFLKSNGYSMGFFVNADIIERELNDKGQYKLPEELNLQTKKFKAFISSHPLNEKTSLKKCARNLSFEKNALISKNKINSYCAAAIAEYIRNLYLENGISFSFESVFSDKTKIDFIKKLKKKGYRVYIYLVATTDPLLNIQRVKDRVAKDGHNVPEDKIISRWEKSINNATKVVKYSDRFFVIDNSQNGNPELIVEIDNGITKNICNKTYQPNWIKKFI